jgi:hypothetical protein
VSIYKTREKCRFTLGFRFPHFEKVQRLVSVVMGCFYSIPLFEAAEFHHVRNVAPSFADAHTLCKCLVAAWRQFVFLVIAA